MPAWAVALAIGGGLVVGFVFLRGSSSGAASSDGEGDAAAGGGGPASSGGASGAPIPWDQLLSGLGITSPDYVAPSYTDQPGVDTGATIEQQAAAAPTYDVSTPTGSPLQAVAAASAASSPDWAERAAARGQSAGATVSTWSISGAAGAGTGAGVQTVPTVATPTGHGSVQG